MKSCQISQIRNRWIFINYLFVQTVETEFLNLCHFELQVTPAFRHEQLIQAPAQLHLWNPWPPEIECRPLISRKESSFDKSKDAKLISFCLQIWKAFLACHPDMIPCLVASWNVICCLLICVMYFYYYCLASRAKA